MLTFISFLKRDSLTDLKLTSHNERGIYTQRLASKKRGGERRKETKTNDKARQLIQVNKKIGTITRSKN